MQRHVKHTKYKLFLLANSRLRCVPMPTDIVQDKGLKHAVTHLFSVGVWSLIHRNRTRLHYHSPQMDSSLCRCQHDMEK